MGVYASVARFLTSSEVILQTGCSIKFEFPMERDDEKLGDFSLSCPPGGGRSREIVWIENNLHTWFSKQITLYRISFI